MALLFLRGFDTPEPYRLKASNAAPPISTFAGAIPMQKVRVDTVSMVRPRIVCNIAGGSLEGP